MFQYCPAPAGLLDLQLRYLLTIAKEANFVRTRYQWSDAGSLLLLAISAGLHRESSLLYHKPSPFEQEMRRRLWAVIAEHELMASVSRGVSPISNVIFHDCTSPTNVPDAAFDVDTDGDIVNGYDQAFTDVSFLCWSQRSFALRARIVTMINNGHGFSFHEALESHDEINTRLAQLPKWAHLHGNTDIEAITALPSIILELQLRRLSLLLHYPFFTKHEYSKFICYESAKVIISRHSEMGDAGKHSLSVIEGDILRAALAIVNIVGQQESGRGEHFPFTSHDDS